MIQKRNLYFLLVSLKFSIFCNKKICIKIFYLEEIGSCSKWDSNDLNRNSPDYREEYTSSPNSQTPTKKDENRLDENKLRNNQEYEDERRKLLRDIEV